MLTTLNSELAFLVPILVKKIFYQNILSVCLVWLFGETGRLCFTENCGLHF